MLPPLRSANHPIRSTYRSTYRSALVQENNSNKVLKDTLLKKIDSTVKKELFLKCVEIIQSNYSKPDKITPQFKNLMRKIFSITIADIEKIVSYSKHESSYFKTFYTTSLSDLLCDLGYSHFDKFSIFPSSQLESLWGGILGIFKKSIIYSIIRDYEIATHPYYGKNICITGALSKPREEYKYFLEEIGAKVVSTVTSKTDFLVCNEASSSSKYKEAQKLAIPVVTEEEFALKL